MIGIDGNRRTFVYILFSSFWIPIPSLFRFLSALSFLALFHHYLFLPFLIVNFLSFTCAKLGHMAMELEAGS